MNDKQVGGFLRQQWKVVSILVSMFLLTGCLYPQERLAQNQVPYKDQIMSVQNAVNQFREANNGLLPIQNRDSTVDIYIKYPVDFGKLAPRFISEAPGNAYESGGIFQYVLIDVEDNPTVKLVDLTTVEQIHNVNLRIMFYRDKHGYPPFKEQLAKNVFTIDYEKLGISEPPYVVSPYTKNNLSIVIDGSGSLFIDYRPDLYQALQEFDHQFESGDDIRSILTAHYDFVPAFSKPYTIENNEPIFMDE